MTRIEMLIDELRAGDTGAMSKAADVLASLPGEQALAEKIHSATGMNARCCTDAAREIRLIYE